MTEVHGSGGGGGSTFGGTGSSYQAPIRISSVTTTHDDVILQAPDGEEQAFQLLDFVLAARDGHALTVLWAIPSGRQSGPYFAVFNHNTRSPFIQDAVVHGLAKPPLLHALGILVAAVIVLSPTFRGFVVVVAPFVTWLAFAVLRSRNARKNSRPTSAGRCLSTSAPAPQVSRRPTSGCVHPATRPTAAP